MEQEEPKVDSVSAADEPHASDEIIDASSLAAQIAQMEQEKSDLQNQLLRRLAEFDNFRRRTEREKSEIADMVAGETLKPLLAILDDFERALKVECASADYARGVELIYQRMVDTLRKLGLEPVAAECQPFDPNLHHAIEMVETDEAEDHTVVADLMKGYTFRGKLLRPSMVKVAVRR
jgi:molecular chaperone GrpE